MRQSNFFPVVQVISAGQGACRGKFGLQMDSIINGSLLNNERSGAEGSFKRHPLDPARWHQKHEALVQAINAWADRAVFEIHYKAVPNMRYLARGRLDITLCVHLWAATQEEVQENLVSAYLSLVPLLKSHLPEIQFSPIQDINYLEGKTGILPKAYGISVHRRREAIDFQPFKAQANIHGFGKSLYQEDRSTGDMAVGHSFPFLPGKDDWSMLVQTMMNQLDPVHCVIRIKPVSTGTQEVGYLDQAVHACEQIMGEHQGSLPLYRKANLLRKVLMKHKAELAGSAFQAGIFILQQNCRNTALARVVGNAMTATGRMDQDEDLYRGGFAQSMIEGDLVIDPGYVHEQELFSAQEAACAFRFPGPPLEDVYGLPIQRARTCMAALPQKIPGGKNLKLCVNNHQGVSQEVVQTPDDRMKHTFILGQTGTGKSTLMESMILQDIDAGHGVAVIDPHGDLVDPLLGKIPKERSRDVVYFDMLDREYPLGFNILQWRTLEERDMIIDDLFVTLDRLYDLKKTGGPIFESHYRSMLKLLMGDRPGTHFVPTLLEFSRCYQDDTFRNWLKKRISDQQVLDFLHELENTREELSLQNISIYITSKLNRFIQDNTLRRIIGQEKTSFDFEKIMNSGKILLIKMGKGRFGPVVSGLLTSQLVAKFKLAAMQRGEMPPDKRRDFFLYVDEAHNLPVENFVELLAEARKFRMGLVLATQYTAQLQGPSSAGPDLLSAILGNVGTLLFFRMGQTDAQILDSVVQPRFSSEDLANIPDWQGYAKAQLTSSNVQPFSFATEKDARAFYPSRAKQHRNHTQKHYGMHYQDVDEQIARRRDVIFEPVD